MSRADLPGAPRTLTPTEADAIYGVLVEQAGARDGRDDRHSFIRYATLNRFVEWRFCGHLGFGGKVYFDGWDVPRIGCYAEDWTPEREAIIKRVNARLIELFSAPSPGGSDA